MRRLMGRRRWIAALLLAAATDPGQAGGQPDTQPTRVGTLVSAAPIVEGSRNGVSRPLSKLDPVWLQMEVATKEKARARIVLDGGKGQQAALGAVVMGEKSRVKFTKWVVDQVDRPEVEFRMLVGDFLAFFRPRPKATGKVRIETPAGTIELHGTAVRVTVAENGATSLYVFEGEVTFRGRVGGPVQVPPGNWTDATPERAPRPPAPYTSTTGPLSPEAHGPAFSAPGEWMIEDPPRVDPRRLQPDLPKSRPPW